MNNPNQIPDIVPLPLNLPFASISIRPNKKRIAGPDGNEQLITWGNDTVSGRSISTYPETVDNPGAENESRRREGDPNADRFLVDIFPNRVISAIADGCNWGVKPRIAATKATEAFADYVFQYQHTITNTHQAAQLISRAFSAAHNNILEGVVDLWEAGTTTMLGGILFELEDPIEEMRDGEIVSCPWVYVWGGVGDCKAFLYSPKRTTFLEITGANPFPLSPLDCGGRLGPYTEDGRPDLRNFRIECIGCEEKDIIILTSDGVHNNLDPWILGLLPSDVGFSETDTWESIDPVARLQRVSEYSIFLLNNLLFAENDGIQENIIAKNEEQRRWRLPALNITVGDATGLNASCPGVTCSKIVQRMMSHCIATNQNQTDFVRNNPNRRIPTDYQNFPGKMDHTTAVAFTVKSQYFPPKPSRSGGNGKEEKKLEAKESS